MQPTRFTIPLVITVLVTASLPAEGGSLRFGSNTLFLPGTATTTENGISLAEVVAEINVSTPSDARWTIELGPGVFDLGTEGISLGRRIALIGAGRSVTTITCECESPVIDVAADHVEIRDLRVDNTSTNTTDATGITAGFDFLHVRDVFVTTAGDDGVDITNSAEGVVLEDLVVKAADVGVDCGENVTASIRNSRLVSTTFEVFQISSGSEVSIEGSTLESEPAIRPVLRLFGGTVTVRRSSLIPSGGTYAEGSVGALEMTQTYVAGGATANLTGSATGTCSATSGDGVFTATTCP